ncbi:MAG: glycoside hydrolase family 78 protein [Kiritimatiellae bacterium]|nr:glycoside hydrolase family 78 protein [Kiritimatiellia bacterium]
MSRMLGMNVAITALAAVVACAPFAYAGTIEDKEAFAGASWIGENGETEMAWSYNEAKRSRGIVGAKGRHWEEIRSPLPKRCPRFRKTFSLGPEPVVKAQVFVTGLGFYELWVNGRKADPFRVLAPGVTSRDRVLADRYDVAALLRPGERNTVGIWLAPGYSDDFSRFSKWVWLAPKRAILKLDVELADGSRTAVVTDSTWETTPESPILSASIYHGEIYDAAREDPAWATPGGRKEGWRAVSVFPNGPHALFFDAPPVRMSDPRPPEKIVETAPGVFTVDFGQNRAGFVSVKVRGPKGTCIQVKTSELLGMDGKIDPWTNYGAKSTDEFILAGTGDVEEYVPRFTYHGFRYAEIRGWPGRPQKDDLVAWAVHADLKCASSFRCSDETLTKLHNAAKWSMLSNFMSYPSDCCMRDERTPCLMDSQVYEDAACEFFDMREYYRRWLDGIRHVRGGAPSWTGDAATLPFRLWRYYGDDVALGRDLEAVAAYADSQLKGHPDYIFTEGHGDWCAPNDGKNYYKNVELVSSSVFCSILGQTAEALRHLGKVEEAKTFAARFEAGKASFNNKFYDKGTHTYGDGSQAASVLPLALGLVPEGERASVSAQLLARIRGKDGGKIDTGIFGTRYVGEVLCDLGECDLLLDMYTQTNYPGFGYMFANGATTLWEQWSFKGGMNSHNHAMFAGGAEWLYSRLAGIRPSKPGYSEVLVKPCYPKRLSFVEATRITPHGEVKVRWDRGTDGYVTVRITIPDGVSLATFEFPSGERCGLVKGENEIRVAGK